MVEKEGRTELKYPVIHTFTHLVCSEFNGTNAYKVIGKTQNEASAVVEETINK